ncbi:MAG: hypothetical protein WAP34_14520 [Desulfomonilia bacterium]
MKKESSEEIKVPRPESFLDGVFLFALMLSQSMDEAKAEATLKNKSEYPYLFETSIEHFAQRFYRSQAEAAEYIKNYLEMGAMKYVSVLGDLQVYQVGERKILTEEGYEFDHDVIYFSMENTKIREWFRKNTDTTEKEIKIAHELLTAEGLNLTWR